MYSPNCKIVMNLTNYYLSQYALLRLALYLGAFSSVCIDIFFESRECEDTTQSNRLSVQIQ